VAHAARAPYLRCNAVAGKTCLAIRYAQNEFHYQTIASVGMDFVVKDMLVGEPPSQQRVVVQLWDTAGQERFGALAPSYFRGAHGIAFVYDVTDRSSFDKVKNWIAAAEKFAAEDVACMLIGNKVDLAAQRAVGTEEGRVVAAGRKMVFFETSAKDDINVKDAFNSLALEALERIKRRGGDPTHRVTHSGEQRAQAGASPRVAGAAPVEPGNPASSGSSSSSSRCC
jgi:small GTP-binding protein